MTLAVRVREQMSTLLAECVSVISCNLGSVEGIPLGEGSEYQVVGETIAIFRERQGAVYGVQAQCPHRAGALADGIVGAGKVICPLHAFKFELATGAPLGHECGSLKTYGVKLND